MTSFTNTSTNYPEGANTPIKRVKSPNAPVSTKNFVLGDEYLDTTTGEWWKLSNNPAGGLIWVRIGGNTGQTETLTGNSGGAVGPDSNANINILGSNTTTVVGNAGTNTLTITPTSSGYPITPYVVGPVGKAGYQTIQAALTAIGAGGSGHIWVFPGTYTENLVFPNGINCSIITGSDEDAGAASIVGIHIPPATGNVVIWRVKMTSSTHIFSSNAAGTSNITVAHNNYSTNGYLFNLPNWTSAASFAVFAIGDRASTSDGVVNNTGGASVFLFQSALGVAATNPMITSGLLVIEGCDISCPIQTSTAASVVNFTFSNFFANIQLGGATSGYIATCFMQPGAIAALTYNSSANTILSDCTIDSSNNPAISGTSIGTLKLGSVTFMNNSTIAGTVTVGRTSLIDIGSIRSTFTNHGVLLGQGTGGTLTATAAGTTGQVLTGVTGANPTFQTPPSLSCSFKAVTSASTVNATGDGTVVTLICNTEIFDLGSNYNNATGTFTAPATGIYMVGFTVELGNLNAVTDTKALYSVNVTGGGSGTEGVILNQNPGTNASSDNLFNYEWNGLLNLTAGDTVFVTVAVFGGTKTVSIDGNGTSITNFYGYRIT